LLMILLSGCNIGGTEVVVNLDSKRTAVFKINGESCTIAEAKVFLTNYQNIYARMYDVDLWNHDFGDNSLESYVKDITISQLAQIKSMTFLAEKENISLTEDELSKTKNAAKEYYDSLNDDEIKYMGVDLKTIETLYEQYGLANKLYNFLTQDVNNEVSEDEARIIDALQIKVSDQEKAKEIKRRLKDGEDFMALANSLVSDNEAEDTEVKAGRGFWPAKVEEKVFSLDNGEIANGIKTDEGYYFVKCINNYNQQLTEENKSVIVERKRKEAFDDVYDEFVSTLPSEYNQKAWDAVKIEIDDKITTSGFFETYDKYCKW